MTSNNKHTQVNNYLKA